MGQKEGHFYAVTWSESSFYRIELTTTVDEAFDVYKKVKAIIRRTKASNLKVMRYGKSSADDFTATMEAELAS